MQKFIKCSVELQEMSGKTSCKFNKALDKSPDNDQKNG
jgi:hypothetical protein